MSIRHYTPRRRYRQGISDQKRNFLIGLITISIIAQISMVLVSDQIRIISILSSAISMALFSIFHAYYSYGTKYVSLYIPITAAFGFFVEALNVATGWPFGEIQFSDSLGLKLMGVPIFVIVGWLMISHPLLLLARQISKHWIFIFGGAGLAAWDLFLDPAMVKYGYWSWAPFSKALPFEPTIPLSNTFGWLLSGMALMAILHATLPKERRKQGVDFKLVVLLLTWIWISRVFSNLFIFHNYGVALLGGVGLGLLLIPLLYKSLLGDV